jgi:hypothetical protein
MIALYSSAILDASAWTSRSLGGKEGLILVLEKKHLDAIDQLLKRIRDIPTQEIERKDFEHSDLTPFLKRVREELLHGKCAAIIRGIDTTRYQQSDCERIFWGFGTHWGNAAVQSARADRIGFVRDEPDDPVRRGYRSSRELVLHTDSRAIIGLMSIQVAASGGMSRLASGTAIHNVIREERPDLMPALYRGYRYISKEAGFTDDNIPIFSQVKGVVSCAFFEAFMRNAAKKIGEALPADLDEALTYFATVAARPDIHLEFLLDPGEIMMTNNFVVLHARTEFKNSEEKKRLLVRLWLNVPDGRPLVSALMQRSRSFDRNHDPRYVEGI